MFFMFKRKKGAEVHKIITNEIQQQISGIVRIAKCTIKNSAQTGQLKSADCLFKDNRLKTLTWVRKVDFSLDSWIL